jgi:DNA-binding FadR family transcriptional regulator
MEAARLAARRRTATDASDLLAKRDARAHAYEGGDLDAMVATDLELHRSIVRTSGNPVLQSLYDNLLEAIGDNIRFNFVTDSHADDAHDSLVEAIVAGNPERAATETSAYLSGLLEDA